jgi:hypothetical protein
MRVPDLNWKSTAHCAHAGRFPGQRDWFGGRTGAFRGTAVDCCSGLRELGVKSQRDSYCRKYRD